MAKKATDLEKKTKFLGVALSISVAFNIALLVNFSFIALKQETTIVENKEAKESTQTIASIASIVDSFLEKNMNELIDSLQDEAPLEEGYKVRDLGLSVLVNFHHLNIEQALSGIGLQKRLAHFEKKGSGEQFEMLLFPGLNNEHFKAIRHFLNSEKWPFTPEGIFYELKKSKNSVDPSLKEAFYKTPHFELIELLHKRNRLNPNREMLLKILLVSDFSYLDKFISQLIHAGDFSVDHLYQLLKHSLHLGSSIAATFLIELDPNYVLKTLEDIELARIIKSLKTRTDRTLYFLRELVSSIRSDSIRKEAATRLYLLYADALPKEINHLDWIKTLKVKKEKEKSPQENLLKEHIIREGDTLWNIARKYKIPIDQLISWNHLDKNKPLQIGKVLLLKEK